MSYESPIKIFQQQVQMKYEEEIFKAIQSVNIYVNKEELIKALMYDRNQYEAGKADALVYGYWIEEQFPLPLSDGSKIAFRCSECKTHWDNKTKCCPNCGARMKEIL